MCIACADVLGAGCCSQNDYGSEEAKQIGQDLIERERVVGLSDSAQVGGPEAAGCGPASHMGGVVAAGWVRASVSCLILPWLAPPCVLYRT